jgi:(E)-4-hydroxy-3-methylbut-2-enyl-diphosphate synthase
LGCPLLLEGTARELLDLLSAACDGLPGAAGRPGPGHAGSSSADIAVTVPVSGGNAGTTPAEPVQDYRRLAAGLARLGLDIPIVVSFEAAPGTGEEGSLLAASRILGSLLCDGIGDAIAVRTGDAARSRALGFNILQAARVRVSKTEFISCPSCGRTLFDLEETTRRIKERTAHLKGLKIAIMGCVVNGPGEMADADFGYVGWGTDKIALFVGKEMVERDIPVAEADDRLVALIKQHGKWQEPVLSEEPVP